MKIDPIRFRLGTLLVAVLFIAVLLTWFRCTAYQQYLTVSRVKALGGSVTYTYELNGESPPLFPEMFAQVYIVELGDLFVFVDGTQSTANAAPITDREVTEIVVGLPNLRQLRLDGTAVTDASIDALKTLQQAEYIGLAFTQMTEEGLQRLESCLPNCRCRPEVFELKSSDRDPLEGYYLDLISE